MEHTQQYEDKLNLIRNELSGKGLDPNDFIQWLDTQKRGGKDLSLWTLDQLSQIVGTYRSLYGTNGSRKDTEESEADSSEEEEPDQSKVLDTHTPLEVSTLAIEGDERAVSRVVVDK